MECQPWGTLKSEGRGWPCGRALQKVHEQPGTLRAPSQKGPGHRPLSHQRSTGLQTKGHTHARDTGVVHILTHLVLKTALGSDALIIPHVRERETEARCSLPSLLNVTQR